MKRILLSGGLIAAGALALYLGRAERAGGAHSVGPLASQPAPDVRPSPRALPAPLPSAAEEVAPLPPLHVPPLVTDRVSVAGVEEPIRFAHLTDEELTKVNSPAGQAAATERGGEERLGEWREARRARAHAGNGRGGGHGDGSGRASE